MLLCLFATSGCFFSSFPLAILAAVSLTLLACDTAATASNNALPDAMEAEGN